MKKDPSGMSDSNLLQAIVDGAENGIAVIPPRRRDSEPFRDWWLWDPAILIPENTTVIPDGIIDTSPQGFEVGGVLLLGCDDGQYGKNSKDGMHCNVICDSGITFSQACDIQSIAAGYSED